MTQNDNATDGTEQVRIAAGALVIYYGENGEEVATVQNVDEKRELIEVRGVPGVLRMRDIVAVGVYGDEAELILDSNGTGGDRITRSVETDT